MLTGFASVGLNPCMQLPMACSMIRHSCWDIEYHVWLCCAVQLDELDCFSYALADEMQALVKEAFSSTIAQLTPEKPVCDMIQSQVRSWPPDAMCCAGGLQLHLSSAHAGAGPPGARSSQDAT